MFVKNGNGGIAVLNSKNKSIIKNEFINLNFINSDKIIENIPFYGGVNFYKSDVGQVYFKNSKSEDGLNIVSSKIDLENIIFESSDSDSFDLDFVNGKLQNIKIFNSKNDGIDISGSIIDIENISIVNSGDKL